MNKIKWHKKTPSFFTEMCAPPIVGLSLLQFLPVSMVQRRWHVWLWQKEVSLPWCVSPVGFLLRVCPGEKTVNVWFNQWHILDDALNTGQIMTSLDLTTLSHMCVYHRLWAKVRPAGQSFVWRSTAADLQRRKDGRCFLHLHGLQCSRHQF